MKPIKLCMRNFGPFAGQAELDFGRLEDIFLITGKTGSGKTSIFDGICFALYGEVPGSRKDHPVHLKSDHASPEEECSVSLEFSAAGKQYLVERRPRQEKPRKRGGGTTFAEETATLYEISGGRKSSATSKKSEADEKIRSLLGLEAKDFSRIILLPQGEFAEFLRQNSSDRQKVMGKLFPVEDAILIREAAVKKARDANLLAEESARLLQEYSSRFSFADYEAGHERLEQELAGAKENRVSLDAEIEILKEYRRIKKDEKETLSNLQKEKARQAILKEEEEHIKEKEIILGLSRQARPLEQYLVSKKEKRASLDTAELNLERAGEERRKAEKFLAAAEALKPELERLENLSRTLAEKRPPLREMLAEEEKLEQEEGEQKHCENEYRALEAEVSSVNAEVSQEEETLAREEGLAAEIPLLQERLDEARRQRDITEKLKKLRSETEKYAEELRQNEKAIEKFSGEEAEYVRRTGMLDEEIKNLEAEKKRAEHLSIAGILASNLKEGEACPVCGSIDHPRPASPLEEKFSFDERIKTLSGSLQDALQKKADAAAGLKSGQSEKKRFEADAENCRAAVREILGEAPLPSMADLEKEEKNYREEILRQSSLLQERGKLQNRLPALRKKLQEGRTALAGMEKKLAALEERRKNLSLSMAVIKEKHRKLLAEHSTGLSGNFTRASEALEALNRELSATDGRIKQIREETEKAGRDAAAAHSAEKLACENREIAGKEFSEAKEKLGAVIKASPFGGEDEAEGAIIDSAEEKALEAEIQAQREEQNRNSTIIAEQEKQLSSLRKELEKSRLNISAEEAEERLLNLNEKLKTMETEQERALIALKNLEQNRDSFIKANAEFEERSQKAGKLRILADDLSGKNPRKTAFDSWLLGRYLEEVAAYASKRLSRMSDSRYFLLLDTEGTNNRGNKGLDLSVFDAFTGKSRPCATLSGGESFMAAISLALGLADSIQSRSGGLRIDAVFIDEGFGSLDEGSLDKALSILDELRDRRMVGLISHVPEMRSRIPCQVEIIKTASGSKIVMP
ncbi:MAG: AAA family ATPase [Treponema sp.]|jgi:exonuclease SbcC|nr:AAA family ATPase [Treponema sp.]